jgi:hypothetical protein
MIYLGQICHFFDQKNWTFGDFICFSFIAYVILLEKAIPHILLLSQNWGGKKIITDPNERNKSYRRPTGENAAVTYIREKKFT